MKRSFKNRSILITGGAGFIGSHLAEELIKQPIKRLIIIDNLFVGKKENLNTFENSKKFSFINDDACDFSILDYIVKKFNIDIVFNCATKPLNHSFINPKSTFDINTSIILNLLELLRYKKYITLCHFSTSEVYGSSLVGSMDENHPLNPTTPYAAGKLAADLALSSYQKCFDLDCFIVRPFNNFGPKQNADPPLAGVIPITINRILNNLPPIIHGDGKQSRDFIFVKDTIQNIISLFPILDKGEIVNISSENEINIHNLILNISNKMSWDGDLKMMKNRDSDVLRHKGCSKKLRNLIKYQLTDFNKALDETINWFRNNKSKNV